MTAAFITGFYHLRQKRAKGRGSDPGYTPIVAHRRRHLGITNLGLYYPNIATPQHLQCFCLSSAWWMNQLKMQRSEFCLHLLHPAPACIPTDTFMQVKTTRSEVQTRHLEDARSWNASKENIAPLFFDVNRATVHINNDSCNIQPCCCLFGQLGRRRWIRLNKFTSIMRMKERNNYPPLHTQQDAITQPAFHLEEKQTHILPAVLRGELRWIRGLHTLPVVINTSLQTGATH